MLSCRTEGTNIEAFSLHPGSIATNLSRHMGVVGSVIKFGLSWFSKTTEQVAFGPSTRNASLYSQLSCIAGQILWSHQVTATHIASARPSSANFVTELE